jgi:deoxyribose-phosphate aldolase
MQAIQSYLDSTYLKSDYKSGSKFLQNFILEAIENDFKLVMIRPEIVSFARKLIDNNKSQTLVGTVIDFPLGDGTLEDKITQANIAIKNGADELDFVINYEAFKSGQVALVKEQVLKCTELCLSNNKTAKWIIEIAALTNTEIKNICLLIRDAIVSNFEESDYNNVFVKSSTGFFKTQNNLPNGATKQGISIMVENGSPLLVKASGGVRNLEEVETMIELGVSRIGTSSALNILKGKSNNTDY